MTKFEKTVDPKDLHIKTCSISKLPAYLDNDLIFLIF